MSMFRDLLRDIFSQYSTIGERCLALFILIITLVTVGGLMFLVFYFVDSVGIKATKTTTTIIESKEMIPSHSTTTFVMSGKVMIPIKTSYPESYELRFEINGTKCKATVKKEFFDGISVEEKIEVDYGFRRLTKSYEPVTIRVAEK
jgi:hypothetical protein